MQQVEFKDRNEVTAEKAKANNIAFEKNKTHLANLKLARNLHNMYCLLVRRKFDKDSIFSDDSVTFHLYNDISIKILVNNSAVVEIKFNLRGIFLKAINTSVKFKSVGNAVKFLEDILKESRLGSMSGKELFTINMKKAIHNSLNSEED